MVIHLIKSNNFFVLASECCYLAFDMESAATLADFWVLTSQQCTSVQILVKIFGRRSINLVEWTPSGPEGHPNNLPYPAWRLAELFFWSDLSWSLADLCANSYVISMCSSLLSTLPSCTCYISYVGILRIIHNVLFRKIRLYDNELGPTDFHLTCYCSYFSIFE
jgi:hypothetical protein